jgi:hypothetical protein
MDNWRYLPEESRRVAELVGVFSACEQSATVGVRYLYAFPESGHLYQPVYLGLRGDIPMNVCIVGLKYKAKLGRDTDLNQLSVY